MAVLNSKSFQIISNLNSKKQYLTALNENYKPMYKSVIAILMIAASNAVQLTATRGQVAVRQNAHSVSYHGHGGHGGMDHGAGHGYHGYHGHGHSHSPHLAGEDESDATRDIVHSYEHRIHFLEAEILRLSKMNNNEDVLEEQVTQMTARISFLDCENKRLRDQVSDAQQDAEIIEELRARIADLATENIKLTMTVESGLGLNEANELLKRNAEELQKTANSLQTVIAVLEQRNSIIPSLEGTVSEQLARISELEDRILLLENMGTVRERALQEELDALKIVKTRLEHEIEVLTLKLKDNEAQAEELEEAKAIIAAREQQISQLTADVASLEAENDDLRAQVNTLNDKLCSCEHEVKRLSLDNKRISRNNQRLEEENASMEARVEEVRSQNEAAGLENNTLSNQLAAANGEIQRANEAIADMEAQMSNLQQMNDELNSTVAQRDATVAELEETLNNANAQIDSLNMTIVVNAREAAAAISATKKSVREKYSVIIQNLEGQNHILQHRMNDYEDRLGLNRTKPARVNAQVTVTSDQSGVTRERDERFNLYGGNYLQRTQGSVNTGGVMVGSGA